VKLYHAGQQRTLVSDGSDARYRGIAWQNHIMIERSLPAGLVSPY